MDEADDRTSIPAMPQPLRGDGDRRLGLLPSMALPPMAMPSRDHTQLHGIGDASLASAHVSGLMSKSDGSLLHTEGKKLPSVDALARVLTTDSRGGLSSSGGLPSVLTMSQGYRATPTPPGSGTLSDAGTLNLSVSGQSRSMDQGSVASSLAYQAPSSGSEIPATYSQHDIDLLRYYYAYHNTARYTSPTDLATDFNTRVDNVTQPQSTSSQVLPTVSSMLPYSLPSVTASSGHIDVMRRALQRSILEQPQRIHSPDTNDQLLVQPISPPSNDAPIDYMNKKPIGADSTQLSLGAYGQDLARDTSYGMERQLPTSVITSAGAGQNRTSAAASDLQQFASITSQLHPLRANTDEITTRTPQSLSEASQFSNFGSEHTENNVGMQKDYAMPTSTSAFDTAASYSYTPPPATSHSSAFPDDVRDSPVRDSPVNLVNQATSFVSEVPPPVIIMKKRKDISTFPNNSATEVDRESIITKSSLPSLDEPMPQKAEPRASGSDLSRKASGGKTETGKARKEAPLVPTAEQLAMAGLAVVVPKIEPNTDVPDSSATTDPFPAEELIRRPVQHVPPKRRGRPSRDKHKNIATKSEVLPGVKPMYTCEVCTKEYSIKKLLIAHMSVHVGAGPFACSVCKLEFLEKDKFSDHMDRHVGDQPYICNAADCIYSFTKKTDLVHHLRTHDDKKLFPCSLCSLSFPSASGLRDHTTLVHPAEQDWKCDKCAKVFNRQSKLKSHITVEHAEKIYYKCTECENEFDDRSVLNKHMKTAHSTSDGKKEKKEGSKAKSGGKPKEVQIQTCEECGKTFKSTVGLYMHRRIHFRDTVFRCPICDKDFLRKDGLKKHMFVHTGERPYSCSLCNNKFTCSSSRKAHMRAMHAIDDKYRCETCNKQFGKKSYLKKHMYQHTGERPIQCTMCEKRFTCKEVMERHLLIHTGEKPHICMYCGKQFRQKSVLQTHMRTHTGDRPYKCQICPKAFITKGNLDAHLKMHGGPDTPPTAPIPRWKRKPPPPRNPLFLPRLSLEELTKGYNSSSDNEDAGTLDVPQVPASTSVTSALQQPQQVSTNTVMSNFSKTSTSMPPPASMNQAPTQAQTGQYPPVSQSERSALLQYGYSVPPAMPVLNTPSLGTGQLGSLPQQQQPQLQQQQQQPLGAGPEPMGNLPPYGLGQYGQMWYPPSSTTPAMVPPSSVLHSTVAEIANKAIMSMEAGIASDPNTTNTALTQNWKDNLSVTAPYTTSTSQSTTQAVPTITSIPPKPATPQKSTKDIRKLLAKAVLRDKHGQPIKLASELSFENMDLSIFEIQLKGKGRRNKTFKDDPGDLGAKTSYSCKDCGQKFAMKKILLAHRTVHEGEGPYTCPLCEKDYEEAEVFERHMKIHEGDKPYLCSHTGCERRFPRKADLLEHLHSHGLEKYQCSVCETWLTSEVEYNTHMRLHKGGVWACEICGKNFARKSRLMSHKALGHNENNEAFPQEIFTKYREKRKRGSGLGKKVKRAKMDLLERQLIQKDGTKVYQCPDCEKTFTSNVGYYFHRRIHTRDVIFKCPMCDKEFIRKAGMRQHMRVHTGERPYACTHCEMCFACHSTMKAHMRAKHAIDDKFKCTHCGKQFGKKSYLTRHLYKHTGEKPIKCPVCDMGFYCKEVLKRHSLIHTGEKPFPCVVCGRAFRQKSVLQTHSRTHSGDRPYKCTQCPKGFITKGNLDHHMKVHAAPGEGGADGTTPARQKRPRKPRKLTPVGSDPGLPDLRQGSSDLGGGDDLSSLYQSSALAALGLSDHNQPSPTPQYYPQMQTPGLYLPPPQAPHTANVGQAADDSMPGGMHTMTMADFHSNMQMLAQAAAGSLLQLEQQSRHHQGQLGPTNTQPSSGLQMPKQTMPQENLLAQTHSPSHTPVPPPQQPSPTPHQPQSYFPNLSQLYGYQVPPQTVSDPHPNVSGTAALLRHPYYPNPGNQDPEPPIYQ